MPDQRVLLTGAAGGIGGATARALAESGAELLLTDVDPAVLSLAAELGGAAEVIDLTDRSAVAALVTSATDRLGGPPTALIHTAGTLVTGSLEELGDADWDAIVAINLTATMALLRAATTVVADGGSITVVSSNAGATPRLGMGAYGATKAGVTSLVRSVGLEVAHRGIRCNTVSPGSTDTPMLRGMREDTVSVAAQTDAVIAGAPEQFRLGIPLGRVAAPADIASTILFLVSDAARHITLHDLRVDGGATLDQ